MGRDQELSVAFLQKIDRFDWSILVWVNHKSQDALWLKLHKANYFKGACSPGQRAPDRRGLPFSIRSTTDPSEGSPTRAVCLELLWWLLWVTKDPSPTRLQPDNSEL